MIYKIFGLMFMSVGCFTAGLTDYQVIMPYKFGYGVNNLYSGDAKEHKESTSENGRTEGEYRWLQPNGLFRVVRYYVDGPSGFIAEVTEEEEPRLKNYMFSNLGGEKSNFPLSASHSRNSFTYQNRNGVNLRPQRSRGITRPREYLSLQHNTPQVQISRESFGGSIRSQAEFLSGQQNHFSSQGLQNFNSIQTGKVQPQYALPNIGHEDINFRNPIISINHLMQAPSLSHEESSNNIHNQQSAQTLVSTYNVVDNQQDNSFISDNTLQRTVAQKLNLLSPRGGSPHDPNSVVNVARSPFESIKNPSEEQNPDERIVEALEKDADESNYINPKYTYTFSNHSPNVLRPEIVQHLTGKINLLPLEPVSQLINPRVVTSDIFFSEDKNVDLNESHNNFEENSQTLLQPLKQNDFTLPGSQSSLISAANTFTPLKLKSGARIYVMTGGSPAKLDTFNNTPRDVSRRQTQGSLFDEIANLRLTSNEESAGTGISSYINFDQ